MAAYHQMGNDSENLVFDPDLSNYNGAILSPVNYDRDRMMTQVLRMKTLPKFEIIFDPQLYSPRSERGHLPSWSYFPKDVGTADPSSEAWWKRIVDGMVRIARDLSPSSVCSPSMVPRNFPDDYYDLQVRVGNYLFDELRNSGVEAVQTAIVDMKNIAQTGRALSIASVLTRSKVNRFYLVLVSDTEPRRELSNPEELKGAMHLIASLRGAGADVIIGFCSSEIALWKAAGASSCATGKFFNLRRFTLTRFAEPTAGGGQLPYWFEESLLAFLRQSDLLRLEQRGLLSTASACNPFTDRILRAIPDQETPWLGLSWRQYMWWFADFERRLEGGAIAAEDAIKSADDNWAVLETSKPRLYMEERLNDGSWVRQWLRAIAEYPSFN